MIIKVKVVPVKPIPGVLPKNKWIDSEMELDLNTAEIRRCMQYGNVYYDGELLDELKLSNLSSIVNKKIIKEQISDSVTINDYKQDIEIVETINEQYEEEQQVQKIVNNLREVSCTKQDSYIILEFELVGELTKKMNGLFKVNSGSRVEYNSEDDRWVKFNNKFGTFDKIEDGTKFKFRFIPNHKSLLKYNISLSEENGIGIGLVGEIDQSTL